MSPMSRPAKTPARETSRARPASSVTPSSRMLVAITMPKVSEASRSMVWYPVRKPDMAGADA